MGSLHHEVAPRPQKWSELAKKTPNIIPKISRYSLSGDPTGATLATKHSFFQNRSRVKLLGTKRGIIHHKVAPRPQKQPELKKNAQNITKWLPDHRSGLNLHFFNHLLFSMFRSVKGHDMCFIGNQPLCFYLMGINKVIRDQEGIPTSQSGSLTT